MAFIPISKAKVVFWLAILVNFSLLAMDPQKPYVTCALQCQLGNQLFQIAATLAYAWDYKVQPIFPDLKRTDYNIPINREKIFFRLDTSALPSPPLSQFNQLTSFTKVPIPYKPNQKLLGWFQSWQYFHHHRQKILNIFAPSQQELNDLKSKYKEVLDHPLTVGVHVRTFNKSWHEGLIPFVGLDYYSNAMSLFPAETLFVIFSDRINWCKHHFSKFNRPMVFIENQDHVDDLFLMSMLKHNIIGNSSFSWWAAYLNQNPKKFVIAPFYFVHPNIILHHGAKPNANMPDWIVLNIDPYAPYPKDMLDYDDCSKSIDTQ